MLHKLVLKDHTFGELMTEEGKEFQHMTQRVKKLLSNCCEVKGGYASLLPPDVVGTFKCN